MVEAAEEIAGWLKRWTAHEIDHDSGHEPSQRRARRARRADRLRRVLHLHAGDRRGLRLDQRRFRVTYNGPTFLATGPLVQGLKYKAAVGLEVDKQQITIAARPTDLINGAPFLIALRDGAFDGATRAARPRVPDRDRRLGRSAA